ncbi:hypothetical protein PENSUB_134 [Penicillium subrubescens]|uniref:Uncharacterized protein n=1 Tax=Penicillium subrubescens TaxID=1316194 RepID=A0A1Q5UNU5_9EURO|nr:hypothetical protein PENSUB_134 [Penicillium subrubescens]
MSMMYDGNAPNIEAGLHFRTQQNAAEFEKAVIELNCRSDFAWSEPSYSGRMYDVVDTGTEHKQYKAIVLCHERSSRRYSDIYYLYRDADFTYDHRSLDVHFPQISFTDYISTHVDQLYRAHAPVGFSHCDKKTRLDSHRIQQRFSITIIHHTSISFRKLPYTRGSSLDMINILARNGEGGDVKNRDGAIPLGLLSPKGQFEDIVRYCV